MGFNNVSLFVKLDTFPVALPVSLLSAFHLGLGIYFKGVMDTINKMSNFSEAATCLTAGSVLVCLVPRVLKG